MHARATSSQTTILKRGVIARGIFSSGRTNTTHATAHQQHITSQLTYKTGMDVQEFLKQFTPLTKRNNNAFCAITGNSLAITIKGNKLESIMI